jgi:hypothetical protein
MGTLKLFAFLHRSVGTCVNGICSAGISCEIAPPSSQPRRHREVIVRDAPLAAEPVKERLVNHPLLAHHRPNLLLKRESAASAAIKRSFSAQFVDNSHAVSTTSGHSDQRRPVKPTRCAWVALSLCQTRAAFSGLRPAATANARISAR